MANTSSQEQSIYRRLSGQIQLGFYDDGEPFPTAMEIAQMHGVSYCPAHHALKALERDGLIQLCRGKRTIILKKPYNDYLTTSVFQKRAADLADLAQSLTLITPAVTLQGLLQLQNLPSPFSPDSHKTSQYIKALYRYFEQCLRALGSQTIVSLYYDISAFGESAFWDILYTQKNPQTTDNLLQHMCQSLNDGLAACREKRYGQAKQQLVDSGSSYFSLLDHYLRQVPAPPQSAFLESFSWEPHKGRAHYCNIIATDLICKLNRGTYPIGTLLPSKATLAHTYHVSLITIRRAIDLLQKLGLIRTTNGVGARVIATGDLSLLHDRKNLMLEENLCIFLEALQFLAITGKEVISYAFPAFSEQARKVIAQAVKATNVIHPSSVVQTISACLQAVIHHCPLLAVREIYGKNTLLLLKGNVLRLEKTMDQPPSNWKAIAKALQNSLQNQNAEDFASAFSQLIHQLFQKSKQDLLDMGITSASSIVTPVLP